MWLFCKTERAHNTNNLSFLFRNKFKEQPKECHNGRQNIVHMNKDYVCLVYLQS